MGSEERGTVTVTINVTHTKGGTGRERESIMEIVASLHPANIMQSKYERMTSVQTREDTQHTHTHIERVDVAVAKTGRGDHNCLGTR